MRFQRQTRICSLLAAVILLVACPTSFAQTLKHPHPYLLFPDAQVSTFKEQIASSPETRALYETLLAGLAKQNPRPSERFTEDACLAYRITRNDAYREILRNIILTLDAKSSLNEPEMLKRDPPWNSALGTADSVLTFAMAFDCIHDDLSREEQVRFANAFAEKGILPILKDWVLPGTRIHTLDTMGHNWWSAMIFSAGSACLAILQERPEAITWLQQIQQSANEWYSYAGSILETKPASFDPAGGFYESINYADFALSEYLRFRLEWKNAFGADTLQKPVFYDRLGSFFINTAYYSSTQVIPVFFGDGNIRSNGSATVMELWALGQHDDNILWYLRQFQLRPGQQDHGPSLGLSLVYGPTPAQYSQAPDTPSLPLSSLYPQMGWATLRSSWKPDSSMLAIRSGFTWNHAHADTGSFMVYHHGDPLIVDSGGTPSYSLPEYDSYYRQSQAHNVVLFNGKAEFPDDTYYGSHTAGSISHLIDAGNLKYLLADNTGPTSWQFRRNFRHVLWIGHTILIIDDVKAYESGKFQWLLHLGAPATIQGNSFRVTGPHGQLTVQALYPVPLAPGLASDFPEAMHISPQPGLRDHDVKTKDTYYAFEPPDPSVQTDFVMAILLAENDTPLPRIERFQDKNIEGLRIQEGSTMTEVYLNQLAEGRIRHRNAIVTTNGWTTDAYLTAMTFDLSADRTKPENIRNLFVADGSFLRRGDHSIYESFSKLFFNLNHLGKTSSIMLDSQPVFTVTFSGVQHTVDAIINGRPAGQHTPVHQTLTLSSLKPENSAERQ